MYEIKTGDALAQLRGMTDESVQCCVTSPPYWGLRDYGVVGQLGLERTPEEYVAKMVEVFREVRRVLRKDGTLWLNLGDSYSSQPAGNRPETMSTKQRSNTGSLARWVNEERNMGAERLGDDNVPANSILSDGRGGTNQVGRRKEGVSLKPKDLCGIPWMVAFALRSDGWYLRQDIIWAKGQSGEGEREGNVMPESVRDRCTKAHEYIFLLSKSPRYYYDVDAIKEPARDWGKRDRSKWRGGTDDPKLKHHGFEKCDHAMGNRRSVWRVNPTAYKEAHFATFPPEIPELCIKAGTKAGDTVLDPFNGAGTTGLVATRLGRNYIGIELNAQYVEMSNKRIDAGMVVTA